MSRRRDDENWAYFEDERVWVGPGDPPNELPVVIYGRERPALPGVTHLNSGTREPRDDEIPAPHDCRPIC